MADAQYRYRHALADICFTGEACCDYCPLLETYARKQCRLTGEYLVNTKSRGFWCPLLFDEEEHANGQSENL